MERFKVIITRTQNSSEIRVYVNEKGEIYYSLWDFSLYLNMPPKKLAEIMECQSVTKPLLPDDFIDGKYATKEDLTKTIRNLKKQKKIGYMLAMKANEYLKDKNFEIKQFLRLLDM